MIPEWFVYVGTLLSFVGGLSYVRLTLLGKVQPNRLSWLLLTIVPMIAFFAALSEGVGKQVLLSFIVGFNPLMIFLASFVNKKAYWKLDRFDYYCGILAIVAIVVWFLSGSGTLAIVFSILAAFAAEPAPTPEKPCCCCKKDAHGQMACCKEHGEQAGEHAGHDMSGMDHK